MILRSAEGTPGFRGIVEYKPFCLAVGILAWLHEVGGLHKGGQPFVSSGTQSRVMKPVDKRLIEKLLQIWSADRVGEFLHIPCGSSDGAMLAIFGRLLVSYGCSINRALLPMESSSSLAGSRSLTFPLVMDDDKADTCISSRQGHVCRSVCSATSYSDRQFSGILSQAPPESMKSGVPTTSGGYFPGTTSPSQSITQAVLRSSGLQAHCCRRGRSERDRRHADVSRHALSVSACGNASAKSP